MNNPLLMFFSLFAHINRASFYISKNIPKKNVDYSSKYKSSTVRDFLLIIGTVLQPAETSVKAHDRAGNLFSNGAAELL
jgi:hypothetical protein